MYNLDIYKFLQKIQQIKSDNKSLPIIKDIILDLSNNSDNEDTLIEIVNMEKVNRKFFKEKTQNIKCKKKLFCTICQNNLKKGEHKVKLCNCGHVFHRKCLSKYMKIKKTNFECPNCKESYKEMLCNIADQKM